MTSVRLTDSRFGMQSPITRTTTQLPSGMTRTTRHVRIATLATPGDPLSLRTQTDTIVDNGRASTTTFDAVARTADRAIRRRALLGLGAGFVLAKYGSDEAVKLAAGRTARELNQAAGVVAAGSARSLSRQRCECQQ